MRALFASVAFLTRIPVPGAARLDAGDVGRAARWFPLVGLLLGGLYVVMARLLAPRLPAEVIAVLVVVAEAAVTGALHFDGLADTMDGFGGGRTRDDVLRIMRDHAVGSYGATALVLLVALKVAVIAALVGRGHVLPWLLLAPVLGRWAIVPLSRFLPYARPSQSVARNIGTAEVVVATLCAAVVVAAAGTRALGVWLAVAVLAVAWGRFCQRRIGGVTGDTLGASVQFGECLVLLSGLFLSTP